MQLRQLLHDDDAVSPVIGVILMVAITVILAAVIASFVLGLGDQTDSVAPQVSLSMEYEDVDTSLDPTQGNLTITHDGGDTIDAGEMFVRGDGIIEAQDAGNSDPASLDEVAFDATAGDWNSGNSGELLLSNQASEISSGQSIEVAVEKDYSVSVVWDPQDTDDSSTITEGEGPAA